MPNQFELPLAPEKPKSIVETMLSQDDLYRNDLEKFLDLPGESQRFIIGLVEKCKIKSPGAIRRFIELEPDRIKNEQKIGARPTPVPELPKRTGKAKRKPARPSEKSYPSIELGLSPRDQD